MCVDCWFAMLDGILDKNRPAFIYLKECVCFLYIIIITRPTHRRTNANLYPPKRQLTKASEPSFDLERDPRFPRSKDP